MILQYSNNGTDCYEESKSICFLQVPFTKNDDIVSIMEKAEKQVSTVWGKPTFEFRSDNMFSENAKFVKIAILSERSRRKSRALMFAEKTVLYLLNENGKTLKMF